jgi:hypothetical protein
VSPSLAAHVPQLIHAAYGGDWAPMTQWLLRVRRVLSQSVERGLFLSVTCAEELASIGPGDVARETAGTFWGDGWVRGLQAQALATFFDRADPWAVDASCFEAIRRPPFVVPDRAGGPDR